VASLGSEEPAPEPELGVAEEPPDEATAEVLSGSNAA